MIDGECMFNLDEDQKTKAVNWLDKHKKRCKIKDSGAIGGKYFYEFRPNSIGVIITLKCACGEQIDLTNSNW
jgi:hypothetical protein